MYFFLHSEDCGHIIWEEPGVMNVISPIHKSTERQRARRECSFHAPKRVSDNDMHAQVTINMHNIKMDFLHIAW